MGVQPEAGRLFTPDEDEPGHGDVVILSDRLWRSRFGADPALVGRPIALNGTQYTVAGIMPADFDFPVPTPTVDIAKAMLARASMEG